MHESANRGLNRVHATALGQILAAVHPGDAIGVEEVEDSLAVGGRVREIVAGYLVTGTLARYLSKCWVDGQGGHAVSDALGIDCGGKACFVLGKCRGDRHRISERLTRRAGEVAGADGKEGESDEK